MTIFITIIALFIALIIAFLPTAGFIIFTCVSFNKGEKLRIENNIVAQPNPAYKFILFAGLSFSAFIIFINNLVIFLPDNLSTYFVDTGWILTIFWILLSWIPILISLSHLKDKGLKYRKWFILLWIFNFIVFLTGIMNPIPQSV